MYYVSFLHSCAFACGAAPIPYVQEAILNLPQKYYHTVLSDMSKSLPREVYQACSTKIKSYKNRKYM